MSQQRADPMLAVEKWPSDVTELAMYGLGSGSESFANPDVAGFGKSLGLVGRGLAFRPVAVAALGARFVAAIARIPATAVARWLGLDQQPTFEVDLHDRRFGDPAWTENPVFFSLRQYFLAVVELTAQLISYAGLSPVAERKARLASGFVLDLLAPTNFLLTNPAALKRAFETGGASVLKGARNFVDDVVHNKGRPRQVDTTLFTIGESLAATPCKVVYRNALMELLQYEPQTEQVQAAPLLCSPPWINKYYIMDLAPGRSFIEWAVKQNRTVFVISYRNPGPDMSTVTMDDYVTKGLKASLDVVADITGSGTVDLVGLCLGGALAALTSAYLTQLGDPRVGNLTLLNTLLDYSEPGASMAGAFEVLRANDLIFRCVASNWLMGKDPPAFDILAWNADSTRLPAAMHAFYLRNFYVENRLATGTLEIAGRQIALGGIKQKCYVVSAVNDHVVPWTSAYATTQLISGPVRFILSSGGHIAGIVNPPGHEGWYLTGDEPPPDAGTWRTTAEMHAGSWWEDWARWGRASGGDLIAPPPLGSDSFPVLSPGPGGYVLT